MARFWSNILWHCDRWLSEGRATRCRKGEVRYPFDNHVLVLGGGKEAVDLLNAISSRPEWKEREQVVLSSQDAEKVRDRLRSGLSPEAHDMKITIYHGERTHEAELLRCRVEQASLIFIVGEDDEEGHDALNVECWKMVQTLRLHAPQVAQCYLSLHNSDTVSLFAMLPQEAHTSVETTILNRYEAMVQQLLMGDAPQAVSQTLDRGLLTANANRYVHLVVVGMTRMGYAFATTAAQLCHFPNYDKAMARPLRTKITFVDPAADSKMAQFKSVHPLLFALSHSRYLADESSWLQGRPEGCYGDFLDVEWEFTKGTTSDEWVRRMLVACANDEQQVLSVAFCLDSADENFSQSFHLPTELYAGYTDVQDADVGSGRQTNIYVYQPQSTVLVRAAQAEVMHLRHLIPFGDSQCGYDPLQTRQTAVAKRVNYLYQKETSGKQFVSMPTNVALLDELWQQLSLLEKMSAIRSATSVYTQLRSLGLQTSEAVQPLDDSTKVEALAQIEHARWNMEKLLQGFGALPATERDRLNAALESDDPEVRQEARTFANRNANQQFLHKDIAPYATLPEIVKEDIRAIVGNLPLVALPYISNVES